MKRLIVIFIVQLLYANLINAQNDVGFCLQKKHSFTIEEKNELTLLFGTYGSFKGQFRSFLDNHFLVFELKTEYRNSVNINSIINSFESLEYIEYISTIKEYNYNHVAHLREWIVKTVPNYNLNILIKELRNNGLEFYVQSEHLSDCYIFNMSKETKHKLDELKKLLESLPGVLWANKNSFYSINSTNEPDDTYYEWQWALNNIGGLKQSFGTPGADLEVLKAWETTKGNSDIRIAILDSGVDTTHPEFMHNIETGYDGLNEGTLGYPSTNFSEDGHGTCCAGIIGAKENNSSGIAGIAPNCKILPVRVFMYIDFNGDITGYTTHIWAANAFNWAWEEAKADVVSNSYGMPDYLIPISGIDTSYSNSVIAQAVKNGRNGLGLPMLFSSGNEPDSSVIWPSSLSNTISVGASTMCDELKTMNDCSNISWGANYGQGLDCVAPGVKIATTDMIGSNGYTMNDYYMVFGGTSASCPYAAGVVALMLSANPDLTLDQVKKFLFTSSEKVGNYNYKYSKKYGDWSMEMGYGRLNAANAVEKSINSIITYSDDLYFIYYDDLGNSYVQIQLSQLQNIEFKIFNILGQKVYYENKGTLESGKHFFALNTIINTSGTYIFRINIGDKAFSSKCIF